MPAIGFDEGLRTILPPFSLWIQKRYHSLKHSDESRRTQCSADEDAVPFPRSAMDGYAVRASDCALATHYNPIDLPVAGRVFAEEDESSLSLGAALAITTGAPVPRSADAVIPHERTERHGTIVRIFAPVVPGDCVFPPGEDFHWGDELVRAGEVLSPGRLALLAFAGRPVSGAYSAVRESPLFAPVMNLLMLRRRQRAARCGTVMASRFQRLWPPWVEKLAMKGSLEIIVKVWRRCFCGRDAARTS